MDIIEYQEEWIKATNHQAFVDRVIEIREEMIKSLDREIQKAVGFDNSLRSSAKNYGLENQLNDLIAQVLFESLDYDQYLHIINSHKIDR